MPEEMLTEFGVPLARMHALAAGAAMNPEERAMLATLGVRAEKYYGSARKLLPLLNRDSRAAMWMLTTIYHRLLDRIAAGKMDVFCRRVSVPAWEKIAILLRGAIMAMGNRVLG